jgi:hypothetical protein
LWEKITEVEEQDEKDSCNFFSILLYRGLCGTAETGRSEDREIVTDKLRSYGVAHHELVPDSIHNTSQYANNRA